MQRLSAKKKYGSLTKINYRKESAKSFFSKLGNLANSSNKPKLSKKNNYPL
jgi:hypothetical protein